MYPQWKNSILFFKTWKYVIYTFHNSFNYLVMTIFDDFIAFWFFCCIFTKKLLFLLFRNISNRANFQMERKTGKKILTKKPKAFLNSAWNSIYFEYPPFKDHESFPISTHPNWLRDNGMVVAPRKPKLLLMANKELLATRIPPDDLTLTVTTTPSQQPGVKNYLAWCWTRTSPGGLISGGRFGERRRTGQELFRSWPGEWGWSRNWTKSYHSPP